MALRAACTGRAGCCAGVPMAAAVVKSFTNWDGILKSDFVGFQNYINILAKGSSGDYWRNNLVILIFIPIQVMLGMIVAVLLYEEVRGWKVFRTLYYLPQIISSVIVGFLFTILFGYYGPINTVLRSIGLDGLAIEWLGNRGSGLFVIIFCLVWINIGWQGMLVLEVCPPSRRRSMNLPGWTVRDIGRGCLKSPYR